MYLPLVRLTSESSALDLNSWCFIISKCNSCLSPRLSLYSCDNCVASTCSGCSGVCDFGFRGYFSFCSKVITSSSSSLLLRFCSSSSPCRLCVRSRAPLQPESDSEECKWLVMFSPLRVGLMGDSVVEYPL